MSALAQVVASSRPAATNSTVQPQASRIPSLDGLRAISIAFVIAAHASMLPEFRGIAPYTVKLSLLGVRVFFVISGFLITSLLLHELDVRGTIGLRRFYARRILRIFPAYYGFLAVLALLRWGGAAVARGLPWWAAATYTTNIFVNVPWIVGHTWSLSIEEQFYLAWPLALKSLGRVRATRLALAVALSAPLIRGVLYLIFRNGWTSEIYNFDFLAAGCLLALQYENLIHARWWKRISTGPVMVAVVVAVMILHQLFTRDMYWRFGVEIVLLETIECVAITIALAWCMTNEDSLLGQALNWRGMRWVGVLSYSLYVWQQLFLRADGWLSGWWALIAVFFTACISYYLLERPFLAMRARLHASVDRAVIVS